MLIDTHSHLNFRAFKNDLDKVVKRTLKENIWFINVGTKYETSKKAVEIAEKYKEGVYAAIGLHPMHLATDLVKIKTDPEEGGFEAKGEGFDKEKYKKLANSKKAVAVGEIGLDYYYRPKTKRKLELFKQKQKNALLEQIELAKELNLPIIFHCRMAHNDLIEILNSQFVIHNSKVVKGVIHCFTGNWEQAERYLEMGLYIGFNGIIFKKIEGMDFEENINKIPLDRILIETDCPYLTPPQAGKERNEPIFVKYVVEKIAKIKGVSYEKIAEATTLNARNLFGI